MRKTLINTLMALTTILFVGYSIYYFITTKETISCSNITFLIQISLNIVFVICLILFTQYHSISLVNNAAKTWEVKKCKYCNHEKSKLVCSACDSIQWSSEKGEIITSIAIFLAHHRWKVINTILTLLLIGPLLFSFKFHFDESSKILAKVEMNKKEENQNRVRINEEISKIIGYSNNIRPQLYQLRNDLDSNRQIRDISNIREFLAKEYFKYAWELAEVVDYLKYKDERSLNDCTYNKAVDLFKVKDLIPILDDKFLNEMVPLIDGEKLKIQKNRIQLRNYIQDVYTYTRAISCAIGEISYNPTIERNNEREKIDGCKGYIEELLNQLNKS